MAVFNSVDVT